MKHQKWYSVPEEPFQFTVQFSLSFTSFTEVPSTESLSKQARTLTRQIESFFREELKQKAPPEAEVFRPAILIPNHNHKDPIIALLDRLAVHRIPCLIVDDGSEPETQRVLEEQTEQREWVHLLRRPQQGGKGAAVMDGLNYLSSAGYTHAVQLDADGQHDANDLPKFLRVSQACPAALVLGKPEYGPDVPKLRLAGRQISRALVWLETLSFAIGDPLLGYRVYPIKPVVALARSRVLGQRMDFDPEIAVRLSWNGVPVRNVSTRVSYPENGYSNFRLVADNLAMVRLHLRLLLGMLGRPLVRASRESA